uniref:Uncharacterized protein n=1 Tax=Trichogramma kaykai TaxID=54128 RepID=A0ABD2W9L6_9HYME
MPLQVLIGIFVQSTLRSKNTILILNRLGVCICYEEIVRIRARLAAYTVQENSINVPIPSHFDSTSYVTTAFDNFDRNEATISGLDSTHDTVIVLFQDLNNNQPNKKPNVSTCTIEKDRRAFSSILKCQEIIDYYPANKEFSPPSYWKSSLSDFIINIDSSFIDLNTNHFLWYLSRFSSSKEDDDLYEQSSYQEDDELHEQSTYQLTPSWTPFNSMVSKDEHCKQKMGFLPICPSSPTNHSTLFTCMKNFDNVRIQFHQDHLVVFCDECIYSSVRQIQSQNATEFDKIILCLGGFHMIKVAFTCIATDQALEQTINRTSNTSGGIIDITRKKEAVAVWNLTFHEFLAANNFLKEITYFNNNDTELCTHEEFSKSYKSEDAVQAILQLMESKNINPFVEGPQPLRNLVTEQLTHTSIRPKLLNIFNDGLQLYEQFIDERFISKSKPLNAPTKRFNLPDFKTIPKSEKTKPKTQKISSAESQRIVELARERNFPMEKLLSSELTTQNPLFDENGFCTEYEDKSKLVQELEKIENYYELQKMDSNEDTCLLVDVMSIAKEINFKAGNKFKDFAMKLCNLILLRATSKTKKIDFVFNSYFDYSIRSSIFKRKFHSGTVVYNAIGSTTNVPKPKYASEPDLNRLEIEEAEIKLMIHLNHVVKNKFTNAHVISSNTDVIVLAMHFFNYFQNDGLQTLWIQVGIDYTLRNVPIHSLVVYHGNDLCQVLPAAHHLTGSDDTSKVGTKFKALQANPTKYLSDFGKVEIPGIKIFHYCGGLNFASKTKFRREVYKIADVIINQELSSGKKTITNDNTIHENQDSEKFLWSSILISHQPVRRPKYNHSQ